MSFSSSSDDDEHKAKKPRLALTSDSMNRLMSAPMSNDWNKENQTLAASTSAGPSTSKATAIKKLSPRIPAHMPDSSDDDSSEKADSANKPPCLLLNQSTSTPDLPSKKRTASSDDDVNMLPTSSPASSHDGSFLIKRMRGNHLSTPGDLTDKQQKGMLAIGASPDLEAMMQMSPPPAPPPAANKEHEHDNTTPKRNASLRRGKSQRFLPLNERQSDSRSAPQLHSFKRSFSTNHAVVKKSLEKAVGSDDHTGDFSRSVALPLFKEARLSHCKDLHTITCDTLAKLLKGEYDDVVDSVRIFDARYPYEYEGGHIRGAENVGMWDDGGEPFFKMFLPEVPKMAPPPTSANTKSPQKSPRSPRKLLFPEPEQNVAKKKEKTPTPPSQPPPPRDIVIFHCEFSSARGPSLMRALRSRDRVLNSNSYPALHHPEVYLLHRGYKEFFSKYPELCEPSDYVPMVDPRFEEQERHYHKLMSSTEGKLGTVARVKGPSRGPAGRPRTKSGRLLKL